MWYLLRKMRQAKPDIIYARRKARQAKLERADFTPYSTSNNSSNSVVFNVQGSDTHIPLNPTTMPYGATAPHQQWDKDGHAVGYASDPRLYVPEPQRAPNRLPSYQIDEEAGVGTSYQRSAEAPGGRSPLRQESGDSMGWNSQGRRDTFDIPRIASPVHEPLHDPFETSPTDMHQASYPPPLSPPPSAPSPHVTQTPTQAQYANYNPQSAVTANITSPPLPNPFTGATPTQSNYPQVPSTDASFYTAEGHSSVPPPNYATAPPRQ